MNEGYLLGTINAFYLVQNNPSASTYYIMRELYRSAENTCRKMGADGAMYLHHLIDMACILNDIAEPE